MENNVGQKNEKAVRWFVSLFCLSCLGLVINMSRTEEHTLSQL